MLALFCNIHSNKSLKVYHNKIHKILLCLQRPQKVLAVVSVGNKINRESLYNWKSFINHMQQNHSLLFKVTLEVPTFHCGNPVAGTDPEI